ncbi:MULTISPECIES: NAD(P)-dependent oxidoreductase [Ramlibacter]|uniref:NAD(P)-dependent oxidoreductase n=1 Tax=Ramlibacter aquaticus TaxID=2780094 RepID=A0ABR9SDU1_9BURK|nr:MULTISPECIES: NAD(P)-dependent oxidoreductase [Ramlibacter]MBE7940528.1 NAD(P)-dependent oxidoreductase [Ramlibacter aquaticus]
MNAPALPSAGVGIVGTGNMGGAMARRLLALGWTVRACDIDAPKVQALAAAGARPAPRPADAAAGSAALIVCVVDAGQAREVLFGPDGAAAALAAGTPVLLCPTIAPEDVEDIAERLRVLGLAPVDAPMSGGPQRALEGRMSLMVACADADFERAAPLLQALSGQVFRIGTRVGDGARTKLVNNLLAGINLVGAAEAIALARRLGLNASATLDVIEKSSGQSWAGTDRMRRAIAGETTPLAHMTLLAKDTGLAMAAAHRAGFEGPLGAHARDTFAAALAAGLAEADDSALLPWLEGRAG